LIKIGQIDRNKRTYYDQSTGMATRSAGAFGNLEAAFYRNDIDKDTMVSMKDNAG
jgi:hypothetical protein